MFEGRRPAASDEQYVCVLTSLLVYYMLEKGGGEGGRTVAFTNTRTLAAIDSVLFSLRMIPSLLLPHGIHMRHTQRQWRVIYLA